MTDKILLKWAEYRISARIGIGFDIVEYDQLFGNKYSVIKYYFYNGYITGTSKIESAETIGELVDKIESRFLPITVRKDTNERST